MAARLSLLWILSVLVRMMRAQQCEEYVSIAAFNIDTFNDMKAGRPQVLAHIARIIQRYDLILLQGIVDEDGDAFEMLMNEINSGSNNYTDNLSKRDERESTSSQFAYLHRTNHPVFEILNETNYYNSTSVFARTPYSVLLRLKTSGSLVAGVGVNIHSNNTVNELNALVPLHDEIAERWNAGSVLILGDLKADKPYVPDRDVDGLSLRQDSKYMWLLPENTDTTVASSSAAYDRFILTGEDAEKNIIPGSAKAFRFDEEYELTQDEATDVSNRYPIEVRIGVCTSMEDSNSAPKLQLTTNAGGTVLILMTMLVSLI